MAAIHATAKSSLWLHVLRDRPSQAMLAACFAALLLLASERASVLGERAVTLALLTAVAVALWHRAGRGREDEARLWRLLALAASAGWLALALATASPWIGDATLVRGSLIAVFFVFATLAAERPHRRPGDGTAAQWTLWATPALLVLGLFLYFLWLPALADLSRPVPGLLVAVLGAYLTPRFAFAARDAATAPWRAVYALLAGAAGALWLRSLLDLAAFPWGSIAAAALSYLALTAALLATRVRAIADAMPTEPTTAPGVDLFADASTQSQAMATALSFPLIHFGFYVLAGDRADPELREPRELLVFAWLLLFGTIAFFQRLLLERRAHALEHERLGFARSLRASEQDLRVMIERRSAERALTASEEKFARAFRFSPDAIAISTAQDGRFVDVNPSFERLTGHRRDDILGHTSSELGIWYDPAHRKKIVRQVRDQGWVRDLELPFRTRTGERRTALFSAQPIEIADEPCLIIVGHDVTDLARERFASSTNDAFLVLDLTGNVRYCGERAAAFFGLSRAELIGRPAEPLLFGDDLDRCTAVRAALDRDGVWRGSLGPRAGAETAQTEAHFNQIRDRQGEPAAFLVVLRSLPSTERAAERGS